MDMTGEYRIEAPRGKVWEALNDPEILKQCIPGCEEIEKTSDTEFTAKVMAKVGPVKARFTGAVTLSDLDPPNGYTISGEGKGGAAGHAKGGAKVALTDGEPNGGTPVTILSYTANAQVGGKLAQIGSRLVQGTAKKMADDFFAKFSEVVSDGAARPAGATDDDTIPARDEAAAAASATPVRPAQSPEPVVAPNVLPTDQGPVFAPAPEPSPAQAPGIIKPWMWIGGLAIFVVVLLLIFG